MAVSQDQRDLTEICAVSRDSILEPSLSTIPTVFADERSFLKSLIDRLHPLASLILFHLASNLDIHLDTLSSFHNPTQRSGTVLRFLHNPPQASKHSTDSVSCYQASLPGHTDSGSVTILFNMLGGLQILPLGPKTSPEDWIWVRPEPGCALVIIGDALRQWTGGILKSCFHRVFHAPGLQAAYHRYAFGYFLKPANGVSMEQIREGVITSKEPKVASEKDFAGGFEEWHRKRNKGLLEGQNISKTYLPPEMATP